MENRPINPKHNEKKHFTNWIFHSREERAKNDNETKKIVDLSLDLMSIFLFKIICFAIVCGDVGEDECGGN